MLRTTVRTYQVSSSQGLTLRRKLSGRGTLGVRGYIATYEISYAGRFLSADLLDQKAQAVYRKLGTQFASSK